MALVATLLLAGCGPSFAEDSHLDPVTVFATPDYDLAMLDITFDEIADRWGPTQQFRLALGLREHFFGVRSAAASHDVASTVWMRWDYESMFDLDLIVDGDVAS